MSGLALAGVAVDRGGRRVLEAIDLGFAPGRLHAVIGPNGAGKSTLLQAAAGLIAPRAGTVALDGVALAAIGRRALARRRAYLPQRPAVDWPITVEHLVALGLTPALPAFGAMPATCAAAVARAIADGELAHLAQRAATTLSGGELARAMLARALVGDPELLIVDEPTAGLDPRHALAAMARLRAVAGRGRIVIMAVHELDFALRFADRVIALKAGRVLWQAAADVVTAAQLSELYEVDVHLHRGANVALTFTGRSA